MAIRIPNAPSAAFEALQRTLPEVLEAHNPPGSRLRDSLESMGGAADIDVSEPLPVYVAQHHGHIVSDASLQSWRYVVGGAETPASADVKAVDPYAESLDAAGGSADDLQVASITEGPFVAGVVDTASRMEALVPDDDDYELRVLEIPSLYTVAMWLHGKKDLFMPVEPAPRGLESKVYDSDEFDKALAKIAEERLSGSEDTSN